MTGVQITLKSSREEYNIDLKPVLVETTVTDRELTTLVEHYLNVSGLRFTFSLNNVPFTDLSEAIRLGGHSTESTLEIEYAPVEEGLKPFTVMPHEDWISSISVREESHCLTGCYDNTVLLWREGKPKIYRDHKAPVKDVQWLSESTFVSGDLHGEIRLWNVGKGSPRANLQGHTQKIVGLLSYSDDLCVSGSADATVQVWRPFTPQNKRIKGEERPSFRAQNILQQTSGVTALAELNKFVWSALADNSLVQWDLTKGQKVSSMLLKRPANVLCANGSLLFAAHSHSTLSIMDPRTFQPLKIKCTAKMISSLSSVQNYILAGHHDGSLRLWDLRNTNAPLWLDPAQEEAQAKILAVELVSTNNFFSGGEDGKLKRYSQ